jgi:hypothetical protein
VIKSNERAAVTVVLTLLALLLLDACRIGPAPTAASPKPSSSPSPSPSPACPEDKSPLVLVQGCTILRNRDTIDLDRGRVDSSSPDFGINNGMVTLSHPAMSMYLGPTKFDALTADRLQRARLSPSSTSYDIFLLEDKGVFALRTGQGHPSKILLRHIDQIASAMDIAFVTYRSASDASAA